MTLNKGCTYRHTVGAAGDGAGIRPYLADAFGHSTAATWAARVDGGEIEVDGKGIAAPVRLRAGSVITWHRAPWDEPDVPLHFAVVREDRWLVAVHKPAGLPTMPAGGFLEHTLFTLVRRRWADASPLHRLGRHTSGIVLFARDRDAASALAGAWREGRVAKWYRALGDGLATWDRRAIDAAIGPMPHPRLGSVHAAVEGGKASRSVARVLERRDRATLFEVQILTGRPHQVRIHLAWAGHPLVGDPLYVTGGVPRADAPGLPGDGGYLLHAERLAFAHPITGEPTTIDVPPPPALERLFGASAGG